MGGQIGAPTSKEMGHPLPAAQIVVKRMEQGTKLHDD